MGDREWKRWREKAKEMESEREKEWNVIVGEEEHLTVNIQCQACPLPPTILPMFSQGSLGYILVSMVTRRQIWNRSSTSKHPTVGTAVTSPRQEWSKSTPCKNSLSRHSLHLGYRRFCSLPPSPDVCTSPPKEKCRNLMLNLLITQINDWISASQRDL